MANLVELFDNIVQMQNLNGVPLAAGKLYVYALGRTRLMDSWSDVDGESLNPNPIILDDAGQAHVYVSDDFDYTIVVCDQYNNEIFSLDKYLYSEGSHSHADVAVAPSESIAVSSYHVGETTVYVPYLTGQLGKVYEGIDPIVVNNQVDKISANHVPLGVQDPLYFVQDDEEGCIIGFSGEALPEGTMNESAFGYEDGKITGYNGSGFSAGLNYEAGSYVDIDGNTINVTGLQPAGNYQSAGDYVVHDELSSYATQDWVENQSYMKEYMESAFYPSTSNPSGYLTEHQSLDGLMSADLLEISDNKITGYNGTAFAGQGGGVTGDYELIQGNGVQITDDPIAQTTTISVTGDFTLVEGNGIQITDDPTAKTTTITVSGDYATNTQLQTVSADITAMIPTALTGDYLDKASADTLYYPLNSNPSGYLTSETDWTNTITAASANAYNEATAAIPTGLATTGDLQTVSGEITAMIPSTAGLASEDWVTGQGYITNDAITGKQDITGMTAYQPAGDYLTTGDSANFATTGDIEDLVSAISETYQPITAMTAYQAAGDYLTTADSANFYTTANESGFISEVPVGTMNESAFSYDASDNITAYNGSAFKAGDEFPQSATEAIETVTANSADWNGTTDTVSSNSGAWGGSALPVSAGKGVKISLQNDTLVFENDETILASGIANNATAFTLSEPAGNFEKIRLIGTYNTCTEVFGNNSRMSWTTDFVSESDGVRRNRCYCVSSTDGIHWYEVKVYGYDQSDYSTISPNGGTGWYLETQKIVGLIRIAGE